MRPARQPPYDLLQGDLRQNLARLRQADEPSCETTWKIWTLLRMGFCDQDILDGLRAWRRASWSTTTVEQGHSAASGLMKAHRQYGVQTVQDRAMLLMARPLMSETPDDKKLRALEAKVAALGRRRFSRCTGRQVYFRDLVLTARRLAVDGRRVRKTIGKTFMRTHGANWRAMAPARRQAYERRAALLRDERCKAVAEQRAKLLEHCEQLRRRVERSRSNDAPLRVRCARLSPAEVQEFDSQFHSGPVSKATVDAQLAAGPRQVRRPPASVERALAQVVLPPVAAGPARPPWLALVCCNRDWFSDAAIRITDGSTHSYWKFVFALQRPYLVCLLKLQPDDGRAGAMVRQDPFLEPVWDHKFMVDGLHFVYTDDHPFASTAGFAACPGLRCVGRGTWVGDGKWQTFEDLKDLFPPVREQPADENAEAQTTDGVRAPGSFDDSPWLAHFLDTGKWPTMMGLDGESSSTTAGGGGPSSSSRGPTMEVDAEMVYDALMDKRQEWQQDDGGARHSFVVQVLGGTWTAQHRGVAYDAFQGQAQGAEAKAFCDALALPKSFRCAIAFEGEAAAHAVASAWCARMQWMFERYQVHGPTFFSPGTALNDFVEDPSVAALWASSGAKVRQRIEQLRGLKPRVAMPKA